MSKKNMSLIVGWVPLGVFAAMMLFGAEIGPRAIALPAFSVGICLGQIINT